MRRRQIPSRCGVAATAVRGLAALVIAAAAAASAQRAWCDPPAINPDAGGQQSDVAARGYRRIFVPADRLDTWPREGRKYIPVEEKDFNRWIESANHAGRDEHASVTIDEANYNGSLDGEGQLSGHGDWKITVRDGGPAFLSLPSESLTIRNARWTDRVDEPVRLGIWGTARGSLDKFGLLAPRSGRLEFDWSVRPQPRKGSLEIPWDVPAAVSTRLTLDLNEDQTPSLEGAAIVQSALAAPDATPRNDAPRQRRWVLAQGASLGRQVLRISSAAEARVEPAVQLELRGKVTYQVEARGLDIQADWKLEGRFHEQRELAVPLPAGVLLLSVAADGQELSWRVLRSISADADQAIISLPSGSENQSLNLKLALWQPVNFDRPWRLPTPWPDDVSWSAAEIGLSVSPEFELRKLTPFECQQTNVAHLGGSSSEPEIFSFAAFSPSAALEVVVGRRVADAQVQVGTSLALTDPDVIGKLVTRWSVSRGQVHQLSGTLGRGWSIETVETIPADAMAEWFVDRRTDRRNLEIRLTDAVTPTREISVVVTGRLQRFNLAESVSADTLRMVRWNAAGMTRHLLSFQSSEPYVVETIGNATRVPRDSLSDVDLALLDEAAERTEIVDMTSADDDAGLQLVAKRGQYAAEIEYEAECSAGELKNSWHIVARPRSNAVDRLLVYSTATLGSAPRWTEAGSDLPITAELLSVGDPLRKNLPGDGEMWLLRLPQPSSKPIEISVSTTRLLPNRVKVPLLALPEAADQSGLVTVRAPLSELPAVEVKGLQPLPVPTDVGGASAAATRNPARLAYRYAPRECLDSSRTPQFEVGAATQSGTPLLTVRHLSIESFFSPDGRTKHRATYELQNHGASEFKATLAENARVLAVYVDGLPVPLSAGGSTALTIPLLPRVLSPTVTVNFDTLERRSLTSVTMTAPVEQEGYPILTAEWRAWLPADFACLGDGMADDRFDWRQRIFGYLAPGNHSRSFDPLRAADWAGLVRGFLVGGGSTETALEAPNDIDSSSRLASTVLVTTVPSVPAVNVFPTVAAALEGRPAASFSTSPRLLGWHPVHHTYVSSGVPAALTICRPATMRSWAVACLIIGFVLNCWIRAGWRQQVFGITLACCLAVLLPAAVAPLATGFTWGIAISMIWSWLIQPGWAGAQVRSRLSRAAPAVLAATLATCCGSRSAVAETSSQIHPSAEQAPASAQIENVLIPVDARKQAVGTKVFVNEQFLRDLLGTTRGPQSNNYQWLISAATYRGELTETRRRSEVAAGLWTLAFNLETSVRGALVQLPLNRDDAIWQSAAMLDGVPQPITWSRDGRSCVVAVPEPGRYVLTMFCTPKTEQADNRGQLHLAVPSLPLARLVLQAPESLTDIQLPNEVLTPTSKDHLGLVAADLRHGNRVSISWPLAAAKESAGQRLSISELNWLRLNGPRGEMTTKLIVEGGSRRPDSLTIRYDDRWTLLTDSSEIINDSRGSATDRLRTLQLRFPKDDIDRQEVTVRWRLSNVAEIGNVRVSPISVSPTPTNQRWFAVSVDPALDCTVANNSIATTTAKEFQNKWGNDVESAAPQLVLANVPDDRPLTFSLRSREIASTIRETLHIAAGSELTRVVYQADITPGPANWFQLPLRISPDVKIDRTTAAKGDQEIPLRWTRDDASHITVFFGTAATSEFRLTVSGSVPNSNGHPTAIPRITAVATSTEAQTVQLYRDDNVNLQMSGFPEGNGARLGAMAPSPAEWLVRPIGAFALKETDAQVARLVVTPNQPIVEGDALTCLKFDGGKWWAELRARLVVEQDELGILQLRMPSGCPGPFEIEANVPVTSETKPSKEGRQILTLRFGTAVPKGKELSLRIRTPLIPPAGQTVTAPDILIAPFLGSRYVGVPRVVDSQVFGWTEVGVEPAGCPQELLKEIAAGESYAFFKVTNDLFTVAQRSQAMHRSAPRVRLAETCAVADQNGGRVLVSRFVIFPDGLTRCVLTLPAEQQLLSAELDNQPALIIPTGTAQWQVTLESANLPQVLHLVSRVAGPKLADPRELTRPTLLVGTEPLPTDISLWTLVQPGDSRSSGVLKATPVTAAEFAALKFDRLVSVAEKVNSSFEELPPASAAGWKNAWVALLQTSRAEALHAVKQVAEAATISQISHASEEQVRRANERMDAWLKSLNENSGLPRPLPQTTTARTSLPERYYLSTELGTEHAAITSFVFDGDRSRISLIGESVVAASWAIRILTVVVVIGGGIACVRLLSNPSAMDFVCRWPHAIGILLGVLYWIWLWPAWVGLPIVAASSWFALRTAWPGRAVRPEASTVLRSTRTLPSQ